MKKIMILIVSTCFLHTYSQDITIEYIDKYKDLAIEEMHIYSIPASIILAQAIIESASGESRLALNGFNHFGIKCHDNWYGDTILKDDDTKQECFRKYKTVKESYRDHSLFLSERGRYSFLFEYKKTDYKSWSRGLKKAGYATNPRYADLLISLIKKYNLSVYDNVEVNQKRVYFSHIYGLPYLTGVVGYYSTFEHLVYSEIQTSFVFSTANIGYNYKLFRKIYGGANVGVLYFPHKNQSIIPQMSAELIWKKTSKDKRYDFILIRTGLQVPLADMGYQYIPYISLSYLLSS